MLPKAKSAEFLNNSRFSIIALDIQRVGEYSCVTNGRAALADQLQQFEKIMRTAKTAFALRLFAPILLVASNQALATTIISVTGPANQNLGVDGGIQLLEASWTATTTYSNVSIAAQVRGIATGAGSIAAYLTTVIGPAETAANVVGSTIITPLTGNETDTLFSGLTLGPGTYHLVLSGLGQDGAVGWFGTTAPTIFVGPGVLFDSDGISQGTFLNSSNPPASRFVTTSALLFQVAGNPVIATPEPGSICLMGLSCLLLAGWGFRGYDKKTTARQIGTFAALN